MRASKAFRSLGVCAGLAVTLSIAGCGTEGAKVANKSAASVGASISSGTPSASADDAGSPGTGGDWDREKLLDFAAHGLKLEINRSDPEQIQAQSDAEGAVDRDVAVSSASAWSNPNGDLAGAVLAVVTSPQHGTEAEPGNPDSQIVPTVDHSLVWIVSFHTQAPKFSDVTMAQATEPIDNPMVDAVATVVVNAHTGEVYFSNLQ